MVTEQTIPASRRPLLLRQAALGGFEDRGPRPLPAPDPVMRWGRPVLLPMSSVMRVSTTEQVVALTYDDGPNPDETPALLDVLAERGARATFFVLTDRAEAYPEVVHRALAEGHEVELHGIDHTRLTDLSPREALRRIRTARQRLEAITGRPVRYFRPPYGAIGVATFAGVRALGMEAVIWSAWARDWSDAPPQEVADRVIGALHPGAIVLLHDTTDDPHALEHGPSPTFSRADVTRRILDGMATDGYASMPVGDLLRGRSAVRSVTVQRPRIPGRG